MSPETVSEITFFNGMPEKLDLEPGIPLEMGQRTQDQGPQNI